MQLIIILFKTMLREHRPLKRHSNYFRKSDEIGPILITEAKINEDNFIVISTYNSNTEPEQLKTYLSCKIC